MADFIVSNSPNKPHALDKTYSNFLANQGYKVVATEVHGKNQTRFLHFILEKNGRKYFSKANMSDLYEVHLNASLVNKLQDAPAGIQFLTPVEILEDGDVVFHIYDYIDQKPVSNESEHFTDFSVNSPDIEGFLGKVLQAIAYVEKQSVVTIYEKNREQSVDEMVVQLLKRIPSDTPYAVELLQHLLKEGDPKEYRFAIDDIQPQNMFWIADKKELILFDLDHIGPRPRYFDHAKFFSQLWVVYDRKEYALKFMGLLFSKLTGEERATAYRYLRFNLTFITLKDYGTFKDHQTRRRITEMMRWIRKDLLLLANS